MARVSVIVQCINAFCICLYYACTAFRNKEDRCEWLLRQSVCKFASSQHPSRSNRSYSDVFIKGKTDENFNQHMSRLKTKLKLWMQGLENWGKGSKFDD